MDYNKFCRNEQGVWDRTKEYEWVFVKVNAEYDSGAYGEYSREVAKGDDTALITALLYEVGFRSEGLVTPLLGKKIFNEPSDTNFIFEQIQSHVNEEQFQTLLDKYCKIRAEFAKRYRANQEAMEKKYGNASKPKQKVRRFRIG